MPLQSVNSIHSNYDIDSINDVIQYQGFHPQLYLMH